MTGPTGAPRQLRQASIHVVQGQSLVVPLVIEGLPSEIEVLGMRWRRKREFHLTVLVDRVLDSLSREREGLWDSVTGIASGRELGPIEAGEEVRRVTHPDRPELQTLIVMAACPGLEELYEDLNRALGTSLEPPPAHVTLYSTDPSEGIGIVDGSELDQRAPALGVAEQAAVRRAMQFP